MAIKNFFVGFEFPNFKPIRTNGEKVLLNIDAKIAEKSAAVNSAVGSAKVALQKELNFLNVLKERAELEPAKLFFFTIQQAQLVGIL